MTIQDSIQQLVELLTEDTQNTFNSIYIHNHCYQELLYALTQKLDKMLERKAYKIKKGAEKDIMSIQDEQYAINLNRLRNQDERDLQLMYEVKQFLLITYIEFHKATDQLHIEHIKTKQAYENRIARLEKEIHFQQELFNQASREGEFYISLSINTLENQQNLKSILRNQAKSILKLQNNTTL